MTTTPFLLITTQSPSSYYAERTVTSTSECGNGSRWSTMEVHFSVTYISATEQVNKFKNLTLTLNNNLTFDTHTSDFHKHSERRLILIPSLGALSISPQLLLLLKSTARPFLLCSSSTFYSCCQSSTKCLKNNPFPHNTYLRSLIKTIF